MRVIKFDWLLGAAFIAAPIYWWLAAAFFPAADSPPDLSSNAQALLLIIVIYPVLEEIVFRGAMQGWLRRFAWGARHRGGLTLANLVTSVVFTSIHLLRRPGLISAGVFIPSLVFGFFRDRYGKLYAPIALHVFYNSGPLWQRLVQT